MSGELYSFAEACAKLGKTESELRELVESGVLGEVNRDGSIWLSAAEVDVLGGQAASAESTEEEESEPAMAGFLDFDEESEPEDVPELQTEAPVSVIRSVNVQPRPVPLVADPGLRRGRTSLWRRFWEGLQDDRMTAVFLFGLGLLGIIAACATCLYLLLDKL